MADKSVAKNVAQRFSQMFYLLVSPKMINFAHVNGLERHIEVLLLRNDCVIVPDLGGFVAHHVDAHYSESEHLFLPPSRTLGFNPQLTMNDSLLVQSYADAYDLSYPEALGRVEQDVEQVRRMLEEEGHCELNDLGTLYKNEEGKLSFDPCESGILTPSLYALDSFEIKQIAQEENLPLAEQNTTSRIAYIGHDEKSGQRVVSVSLRAIRNAAVAACVLAACVFVISPVKVQQMQGDYPVKSGVFSNLYDNSSNATPSKPIKLTAPAKSAAPKKAAKHYWTVVLCTHVPMSGAQAFCSALQKQGYDAVRILDKDANVKVVYGQYDTEEQARQALREMKPDKYFNTAWVLRVAE